MLIISNLKTKQHNSYISSKARQLAQQINERAELENHCGWAVSEEQAQLLLDFTQVECPFCGRTHSLQNPLSLDFIYYNLPVHLSNLIVCCHDCSQRRNGDNPEWWLMDEERAGS